MNAMLINSRVSLATTEESKAWFDYYLIVPVRWRSGGRIGTVWGLTVQDFAKRFGNPHLLGEDDKTTATWYFWTPRGPVQVGDYWWNRADELSVRAVDKRAFRWFRQWAKQHGLKVE